MALYVEVMCDLRIPGTDPTNILRARCWSDGNDNPQGRSVADARDEARRRGWKMVGRRAAICPGCLAAQREQEARSPVGASPAEQSARPRDERSLNSGEK